MPTYKKENCYGCKVCSLLCPNKRIKMSVDEEGFYYPETGCTDNCGICDNACFWKNYSKQNSKIYGIYAVKNKNDEIRYNSSSGGIFTLLAEDVIDVGGVVIGAGFSNTMVVQHYVATSKEDLQQFRKSKYVKSELGDTFEKVKELLHCDKIVLFSGTPCQIAALKSYIREKNDNLITVDVICKGVSSPIVWEKYITELQELEQQKIVSTIMREKDIDNYILKPQQRNMTIKFILNNREELYQRSGFMMNDNKFLYGFDRSLYLSPACYACKVKGFRSGSDIKLGDFWDINKIHPEFCDKYVDGTTIPFGVSIVIILSDIGNQLFKKIKHKADILQVDEKVLENPVFGTNYSLFYSMLRNPMRETFYKAFKTRGFHAAFIKCKHSLIFQQLASNLLPNNIKHKIRKMLVK